MNADVGGSSRTDEAAAESTGGPARADPCSDPAPRIEKVVMWRPLKTSRVELLVPARVMAISRPSSETFASISACKIFITFMILCNPWLMPIAQSSLYFGLGHWQTWQVGSVQWPMLHGIYIKKPSMLYHNLDLTMS